MDKFIPEDVRALIERLEARKGDEYLSRKRAAEAERERLQAIEKLREERADDLRAACDRIEAWIDRFNATAGSAIWQLLGEKSSVVLFSAKFWRGEPAPPGDIVCSAQLRLGGPGTGLGDKLVYEELHKGQVSSRHPLLGVSALRHSLHPDFVMRCDAHLAGPDAWKYVRLSLERLDRQLTAV